MVPRKVRFCLLGMSNLDCGTFLRGVELFERVLKTSSLAVSVAKVGALCSVGTSALIICTSTTA